MNQRIKELLEQAGFDVTRLLAPHPGGFPRDDFLALESFAELIVKKFDDILVLEYLDCVGNNDKQAVERIQRLQEKVKTYFGVEE